MRKTLAVTLSFFLFLFFALAQVSAIANMVTYTAPSDSRPGELRGNLPLPKLGPLLLPRGQVTLSDSELKILAVPRWLFDRNLVLQGAIVRAELVTEKNTSIIGGLVYFYDGQWLFNLGNPHGVDIIDTIDDTEIRGRILSRTGESFVLRRPDGSTQNIAFANIKSISSPRAFSFNIVAPSIQVVPAMSSIDLNSNEIIFASTQAKHRFFAGKAASLPRSNLSGTELAISNRTLATFVALDIANIISPAIVAPLVLNPRTQQAAINAQIRFVQRAQAQSIRSSMISTGSAAP